ncbi:glycosyltransferase family 2 protein [Helicobacter mesocricetorum]|uniref:glycosyltransferase family 2 protein n=1 Tax=Helicobacter mesocricetorum TaxID=87012 RepID=UPI000CF06232|nr:glycosyltransferase family 2 protein [Helicobacter mesocricetorum]
MITTINNNKKIGVIIPIYNVEKYLRECLDSVVNQTYTHLVIVLVNDGSSDSSFEIAKEYALYDDRIILFNKNNGGQGSARNVGINFFKKEYEFELIDDKESFYTFEVESGEDNLKVMRNKNAFKTLNFKKFQVSDIDYLMFLDSDDYWALDCVESCLEKINGVDLVWYGIGWFGKSRLDFECNTTITNIEWLERMIEKGIGYFWNANFFMADFKLFKNYKLHFINHIIFEDHIFGIELFTRAEKIYILNKTLYYYRTRPNSTSNHNRKVTKEQISPYFNFLCEDFKDNYEQTKAYFKAASVLIYVERLVDFIQKLSDNKLQSLLKKAFLKHYLECSLLEFSRIYKDPMHISHTICVFIDEEYENNIKPFSKSSKGEILLWIQRVLREKYHTINNSQLQNSILNTKLKIIEMRANYGTASSRLKSHLAYKLGEAMILNSKSLLGYIRMPYVLSYIKDKHNKEQKQYQEKINKNPKLKLPPLESYSDYKESLKIKTTLSYKLGEALIKAYKQNFFKFPLPFIANNTNYNGGGGHTMVLFNRI